MVGLVEYGLGNQGHFACIKNISNQSVCLDYRPRTYLRGLRPTHASRREKSRVESWKVDMNDLFEDVKDWEQDQTNIIRPPPTQHTIFLLVRKNYQRLQALYTRVLFFIKKKEDFPLQLLSLFCIIAFLGRLQISSAWHLEVFTFFFFYDNSFFCSRSTSNSIRYDTRR